MNFRILIAETRDFSPEAVAQLRRLGEVILLETPQTAVKQVLMDYDVVWFRLGLRINAADIPTQPRCQCLVCPVTGLDHIDETACKEQGISILSLRGETVFLRSVRATAELTIALTLALLRHLPQAVAHVRGGGWSRDLFKGRELLGKTVGIAGMGRLGAIAAQYFHVFGCRVLGYDPVPFQAPDVEPCESLEVLVAQCDIVSLHINYRPENHHLLNDALLSAFKPGSILINTSRGGLVDSQALVRHLESGHLSGAALDVVEDEHQHQLSPLIAYARQHQNLIITPHIGGNTVESFAKTELFMAQKLLNHLQYARD